jgi:hypothetical protein
LPQNQPLPNELCVRLAFEYEKVKTKVMVIHDRWKN